MTDHSSRLDALTLKRLCITMALVIVVVVLAHVLIGAMYWIGLR